MATSYTNPGGSGNRSATIAVFPVGAVSVTTGVNLVNGNLSDAGFWWSVTTGCSIEFWFNSKKIIDEAKLYQQDATSHGTWKWQGSNDRTTWTDIGSTFTLGGATSQTITTLSGNTTGYIFYRLLQVSGTTSSTPYLYEFEFKIDESDTKSYSNTLGSGNRTASITVTQSGITWSGVGASAIINGAITNESWWNAAANAGHWVQFDLGAAIVMQQARVWFDQSTTQGAWQWQGSNDASAWTNLGSTFTLANTNPSPALIGGFESNTTAYRYYRMLGISGSRTSTPYVREFEFLVESSTPPPTFARVSQVAVEILVPQDPPVARVSQVAVEVMVVQLPVSARVSQVAVEVLYYPQTLWPTDSTLGPACGDFLGEGMWVE